MMNDCVSEAIRAVVRGKRAFCKFLTARDIEPEEEPSPVIRIPKSSGFFLHNEINVSAEGNINIITIQWQNGSEITCDLICSGEGKHGGWLITGLDPSFPYLQPDYIGALFVLILTSTDCYRAFVLNTEDEINQFLDAFAMSVTETDALIQITEVDRFLFSEL